MKTELKIRRVFEDWKTLESPAEHLAGAGATFRMEQRLLSFYEKKFAIMFSSATTGMQAICLAANLAGREMVTTPINWGGALAPFLLHGTRLRFAAVEQNSLNLTGESVREALTPKTKCVLSCDLNGLCVDGAEIAAICRERGILYISDSARSLGAIRDGKPPGYYADATVVSFSAGKTLCGGEGGAILTDREDLFEKIVWISQHPSRQKTVFGLSHFNQYAPLNGRINPLASILIEKGFDQALADCRRRQDACFGLATDLRRSGMVNLPPDFKMSTISTFRPFVLRPRPRVTPTQIREYMAKFHAGFETSPFKVLPFHRDQQFREQFRGCFTVSQGCNKLEVEKDGWITIVNKKWPI